MKNEKVEKVEAKQEIIVHQDFSLVPESIASVDIDEYFENQEKRYLPYCFFTNDKNSPADWPKRVLCLCQNRAKRPVKLPYVVSLITLRPTVRPLQGTTYGSRYYEAVPGFKTATGKKFDAEKDAANESGRLGLTYVYYLIEALGKPEQNALVVTQEAFKNEKDYVGQPLRQAKAVDLKGAEINLASHAGNTKVGANGPYLHATKFTQFVIRDLTDAEKKILRQAYKDNEDLIQSFREK